LEQNKLISIVIDNYNYARFLPDAIDSALSQTHPNMEVIVVDDGSTDHSRQVIENYAARYGDKIKSVFKTNGGQESAVNAGFALAQGEIVMFCDADDKLLPDTAQRVVARFEADPKLAKVQYRMAVIDGEGNPTGEQVPPPHMPLPSGDLRKQILTFAGDMPIVAFSGNAYSRAALQHIFPIPTHLFNNAPDHFMCNVICLFGNVATLDGVGVNYRIHGANNYTQPFVNLPRLRREIGHQTAMRAHVAKYAQMLGLPNPPKTSDDIVPVSAISYRMISLKLEPDKHPVPTDTVGKLCRLGLKGAASRFDVSPAMRLFFRGWFLAMAVAPNKLAHWLAEMMLFPHKRPNLINATFGKWQRARAA
jgi:glycosyltransferase involved in cell wall biosynthesis